ncbi:hypothetical protein OROGR_020474 [Orobanche gracilis]
MEKALKNIEKQFPYLSKNAILRIYGARAERMRLFMLYDIPHDIRFTIEAKARIAGESIDLPTRFLPGLGKSSYAKKRRAKKMYVCYKCARWTCDQKCRSLGIPSTNREDKIEFIKNGLSKEKLNDIQSSLETHSSGLVYHEILCLWNKFNVEYEKRLGNLTVKGLVCQFWNRHLPLKNLTPSAFFGRASYGNEACFTEAAHNLGRTLGKKCIHVVYGGGSLGLMGRAAASAYMEGVKVLGIIPKPLAESKITGATIRDEFRAVNMQDRITHMTNNADAFITLPGGFGTLEELFHVVTRAQLNVHKKPIGLLNVNGFFDGLLSFIDFSYEKGFISERAKRIIVVATTPEDLIKKLIAFVPEPDPALATIVWKEDFTMRKRKTDAFLSL